MEKIWYFDKELFFWIGEYLIPVRVVVHVVSD